MMEVLCKSPILTNVSTGHRYRINWFVIYMVTLLNGISPFIQIPSLHQYVTSHTNQTDSNLEPGLGLGETWYSAIISIGSIGAFIGAVCFGIVARYVYMKPVFVSELLIALAGGLLYSFSFNGWMLLIGRFLVGMFTGIHMSAMRAYVFETSSKLIKALPINLQRKSTIKYTAIFFLLFHGLLGRALAPAIVAVGAQFDSISEFHWPGYCIAIHSFVLLIFVLFSFNERWDDVARRDKTKMSWKLRLLLDIKTPAIPHYLSIVFIYLFLMMGWNLSIIETLQNPILSDQFGLNVKETAYVFIGVLSVYLISLIIMYSFQKLKIDNRIIVIFSLLVGVAGTVIMTDWQAIRGDPCIQAGITEIEYEVDSTSRYECETSNISSACFWNPNSRVTGDYCERCRQVCLSKSHSLNFVQLLIGLGMISFSLMPGRVLISTIASDIAGGQSVASLMGALVAAGAVSQASGPLWTNYSYLAAGHHTWLPMMILLGVQFIGLALLLIVYKKMAKGVVYFDEDELLRVNDDSEEREVLLGEHYVIDELDSDDDSDS